MLLNLAWRNLWRNTRRTSITVTALSLGVLAIVFLHSYRESVYGQMVRAITTGLIGHFQVHGQGYQAEPELSRLVQDPVAVEASLTSVLPSAKPLRRVLSYGLAGAGETSAAALVMGIQPERELSEAPLFTITRGTGLSNTASGQAVLGYELAAQLGVEAGAELVLVGQAVDGSTANDRYTVVGLADAQSAELNSSAVFLHLQDAQNFFGLQNGVHQLLVRLPAETQDEAQAVAALRQALDVKTLEVLSWREMLPDLEGMMKEKREKGHALDFVVFLIVALGALNAMTMSTFERTREFGVMSSLGARPRRILALVLTESFLQAVLGLLIGTALSLALMFLLGNFTLGDGLSGTDMMGVRFPSVIELKLQPAALIAAAITSFATMLVGGLWPAIRASKLRPAEAVRRV